MNNSGGGGTHSRRRTNRGLAAVKVWGGITNERTEKKADRINVGGGETVEGPPVIPPVKSSQDQVALETGRQMMSGEEASLKRRRGTHSAMGLATRGRAWTCVRVVCGNRKGGVREPQKSGTLHRRWQGHNVRKCSGPVSDRRQDVKVRGGCPIEKSSGESQLVGHGREDWISVRTIL